MAAYPSGEGLFSSNGFYNQGGYADKTMDRLIDESTNAPGLTGLHAYEDYTSAQQPVLFFATESTAVLERDRIHGMEDFIDPAAQLSPEQLYCTPGTAR